MMNPDDNTPTPAAPTTAKEKGQIAMLCVSLAVAVFFVYILGYNKGVLRQKELMKPYMGFYECISTTYTANTCEPKLFKELNEAINPRASVSSSSSSQ